MADRPASDPSVEFEPHLANSAPRPDPSELAASEHLAREASRASSLEAVDHTVWDEPALSPELSGGPHAGDLTYAEWLREQEARTTWSQSLAATVGVAAVAGPWGVLGALLSGGASAEATISALVAVALVAPVTEEVAKVAAAWWVVEKRPFWFKSSLQIMLCGAAGGAVFAAIENLLYLYVYARGAGPSLAAWRWTVCVALHVGCSTIAGAGLARVWRRTHREATRPLVRLALPGLIVAMTIHGAYNATVTIAETFGWLTLGR